MDTHQTLITPERPDSPDARLLIAELETELSAHYPPTSRHGYSVQKLIDQGVIFSSHDTTTLRRAVEAFSCSGRSTGSSSGCTFARSSAGWVSGD